MTTATMLQEPYMEVLARLGDVQQQVNEAVRQYALQQAQHQILDLETRVQSWEAKYGCSYDLFAYRTATDEDYVHALNAVAPTQEWEADLFTWEFYATELKEWRQRLAVLIA
jgi:hypothetical protein